MRHKAVSRLVEQVPLPSVGQYLHLHPQPQSQPQLQEAPLVAVRNVRDTVDESVGMVEAPIEDDRVPVSNSSLFTLFRKLDRTNLFTEEEHKKIMLIVAYNRRRAILRLLLGIYQRAQIHKLDTEVKFSRMCLALHEMDHLEEQFQ